MSNTGKFTKNNKAAANRKSKSKNKAKYFQNKTVINPVVKETKVTDTNTNDYIEFGSNNLFPQKQAELSRKSAILRSVINSKRDYVLGEGFSTDSDFFKNYIPSPSETMEGLYWKLLIDRYQNGNYYIEVVKINGQVLMNHVDSTKCRGSEDRKHIIVHPDWANYRRTQDKAKVIPLYPEFGRVKGLQGQRSIVHVKDYEPTFSFYGVPSNIAGEDSAIINWRTNNWNKNRLVNSFQTSGVLLLNADLEDDDAKKFSDDFDSAFTGDENAGKPMKVIQPSTGERNDTKWIPFDADVDGSWTELHDQAVKEICTANQWFPTLSGLPVATGFETERIRNEYQIAVTTTVSVEQMAVIEVVRMLFRDLFGQDLEDLKLINKTPVGMFDADEMVEAINELSKSVSEGVMSVESAQASMMLAYNLSEEEVEKLFK
jgi:hypothetical protein